MSPEEGGRHGGGTRGSQPGWGLMILSPEDRKQHLETSLVSKPGWRWGRGATDTQWVEAGMMLGSPQCTGQPPLSWGRFVWCRMSWVLRQKSVSREGGSPRRERDRGGAACPAPGDEAE